MILMANLREVLAISSFGNLASGPNQMGWCSQMVGSSLSRVSNFSPDMDVSCLWVLPLPSMVRSWERQIGWLLGKIDSKLFMTGRPWSSSGPIWSFSFVDMTFLWGIFSQLTVPSEDTKVSFPSLYSINHCRPSQFQTWSNSFYFQFL